MIDIFCQSIDPEFADILSRICKGKHRSSTIIEKIDALEDSDTSAWPENCVNLYLTNYLARRKNTKAVEQLNSEEFIIRAENSSKDVETGT